MGYKCDQCNYIGKKICAMGKMHLCPSCYEDYAGEHWISQEREKE